MNDCSLIRLLLLSAICGAAIGAVWWRKPLSTQQLRGLSRGVAGVAVLGGIEAAQLSPDGGLAIAAAVIALGVLCSGVAYLLYFRLIADIGATPALTVTFLIPVFGVLWGHLFLGEAVGWHTLLGATLVLAGTGLTTGFSPASLLALRRSRHAHS